MKPRRHECGLYLADHLRECPKCGKKVKPRNPEDDEVADAAEEAERLAKLNSKAKILDAAKFKWVLPKAGQDAHKLRLDELRRRLKRGDKTVVAELKLCERIATQPRAGRWSWGYPPARHNEKGEVIVTRGVRPTILISPKGNQYVQCHPNEYADILLDYSKKKGAVIKTSRFRRWEKSSFAKLYKKGEQEIRAMKERKKAKKERRRAKKKLIKRLKAA